MSAGVSGSSPGVSGSLPPGFSGSSLSSPSPGSLPPGVSVAANVLAVSIFEVPPSPTAFVAVTTKL